MKKATQRRISPVALLVLLVLLALLTLVAVKRRYLTAEGAIGETVGAVVKVENTVRRDKYAAGALLALITLFAFVTWAALRAKQGEDQAVPPAGGGDSTPPFDAK
jgi:hypothetical protein